MTDTRRRLRGMIADMMGVSGDQAISWTPELPIIYVSNPKAASTTIKHSLKLAQAAHYIQAGIAFERSELPQVPDECLKTRGLCRPARSHRFLISCVRNPFTRALSGYLERVATENPRNYPELRNRKVESFEQHLLALADFRPKRLNMHFRPQHINLDFPNIFYDAIFYLENLSAMTRFFAGITPEFKLETSAPHSQSAGSKLRVHYTDRAVKLVQEIFARDFSLFGYSNNLDDAGVIPGECIAGDRIVFDGSEVSEMALRRPARTARCRAFDATMRYHQLIQMKVI